MQKVLIPHKGRTLLQWDNGIWRRGERGGGGLFITLTPCVPRYAYFTFADLDD